MHYLTDHILSLIILLPIAGAGFIFMQTNRSGREIARAALGISIATFILALFAARMYVQDSADWGSSSWGGLRLVEHAAWLGGGADSAHVEIQYYLGVDGISLPLLLLTAFLTPLAIWGSFTGIQERQREYYALMLLLHGAMLGVFCARDLLLFYIFFEFTLIPLYFLIGIWGGSQRHKAANMFFIYTLTGSMLTFAGVMYLGYQASLHGLGGHAAGVFTFDIDKLYELGQHLTATQQTWLFLAFFAGFAIKVPLFPFHTWLPLAHTEAPTAGSVILAGVLLKLGTYGFLRLSLPMLPDASYTLAPLVAWLAVIGIIYGAVAAWVQSDFKKLVAYSSVSHLGFCLLGMFSMKTSGLQGSLLYMINHGLSTGALFLLVGMIYERYHTREMSKVGGLARKMPIMTFFMIVFVLSSVGLPGLNGFVSEFLVLLGAFTSARPSTLGGVAGIAGAPALPGPLGIPFAAFAATGIILSAVYMFHMARGILFGPLNEPAHTPDTSTGLTQDLTRREIGILTPIAAMCLLLGVYPKPVLELMRPALERDVLARVYDARLTANERQSAAADVAINRRLAGDRRSAEAPRDSESMLIASANEPATNALPFSGEPKASNLSVFDSNGVAPPSPGLSRSDYPGYAGAPRIQSQRGCATTAAAHPQRATLTPAENVTIPSGSKATPDTRTQNSRNATTLGWKTQRRWRTTDQLATSMAIPEPAKPADNR